MFSHISQANLYIALPAVIFVLFLLQKLRNYRLAYSNGCKPCPHYPHRDPFGFDYMIQNARAFKEAKYLPKLLDAFDQFGHTWQRNVIGTPVIATMDPVNIQAVLIAKDEHWGVEAERNVMWRPLFGKESVFTNDGHIWGYSRNLIKPAINATEYKNFDKFEHHFQSLLQLLPKEDGQAFNMGHVLEVFMAAFGLDYFFGSALDCVSIEHDNTAQRVIRAFDEGLIEMIRRSILGRLAFLKPATAEFKAHCAVIERFVDDQVNSAKKIMADPAYNEKSRGKAVLIEEVLKLGHDREFQQGFLRTLFIGGTDTTQVLLANVMWMIAREPEVVRKLREEVHEAFPNGVRPDLAQLRSMKYLKAVINETFRLHPVTPITNRISRKATTLPRGGGPDGSSPIYIPKGTRMFLATYAVHRDKTLWGPDADTFRPERWFPIFSGAQKMPPYTFLPFSAGVRVCPGMPLALANAQYFVARFLQYFERIESRDDREWRDEMKITCPNAHGVVVALRRAEGVEGGAGGLEGMKVEEVVGVKKGEVTVDVAEVVGSEGEEEMMRA